MVKRLRVILVASFLLLMPAAAQSQNVSFIDVVEWLRDNQTVSSPSAGTYGRDRLASLAAFVPPGLIGFFDFDGVVIEIQPIQQYSPHASYQAASSRHRGTARIAPDGSLRDYSAGRPFTAEQIAGASEDEAGYMVAWNHIFRWQYYGLATKILMTYVAPGEGGERTAGMQGSGVVVRSMTLDYRRVYLNKLAHLPGNGYRLKGGDGGALYWKEFVEFLEPFDVAGTKFVVERSLDPSLGDEVFSYLPGQRRVRRLSAKERADSWMGSDFTLDDLQGFSGRVLDYRWRYLGRKDVLHVADSKNSQAIFFGPSSRVPNDRWQVRSCHVVELVPRWAEHPYGRRLQFVDSETYDMAFALIFDRRDVLWKILYTAYEHPEIGPSDDGSFEGSVPRWSALVGIDLLNGTTTLSREARDTQALYTKVTPSEVRRIFDVSTLTSGR